MSDLNKYIDTTRQYSVPASMDALPINNHAQQVNVGVEIARRAAQQEPAPAPKVMAPIVPVAN